MRVKHRNKYGNKYKNEQWHHLCFWLHPSRKVFYVSLMKNVLCTTVPQLTLKIFAIALCCSGCHCDRMKRIGMQSIGFRLHMNIEWYCWTAVVWHTHTPTHAPSHSHTRTYTHKHTHNSPLVLLRSTSKVTIWVFKASTSSLNFFLSSPSNNSNSDILIQVQVIVTGV